MIELIPLLENFDALGAVVIVMLYIMYQQFTKSSKEKKDTRVDTLLIEQNKMKGVVYDIKTKNDDLHLWHSKTDEDGVKIWYVRRSFEDAVVEVARSIQTQTALLEKLFSSIDGMTKEINSNINTMTARLVSERERHYRETSRFPRGESGS